MATVDPIAELRTAGIPVDDLTEAQRDALRELSPAEVAVLIDISRRLADAEPDVVAHTEAVGGLFF